MAAVFTIELYWAVGKSRAEFIGTAHAIRLYPNGQKLSRWAGATNPSLPPGSSAFITYMKPWKERYGLRESGFQQGYSMI